jgi:Ca2+-transporting ATPase
VVEIHIMVALPWISPIHHRVKGRTRYKIRGLRGCAKLKERLEIGLVSQSDIYRVSASTLTGNLLILYNPARSQTDLSALIDQILLMTQYPSPSDSPHALPPAAGSPGREGEIEAQALAWYGAI